ncbi:MAG: hypothetical protein JWN03_5548 [Nocardia sp.]|nr:hypothetical protein [Nocardia sp.]
MTTSSPRRSRPAACSATARPARTPAPTCLRTTPPPRTQLPEHPYRAGHRRLPPPRRPWAPSSARPRRPSSTRLGHSSTRRQTAISRAHSRVHPRRTALPRRACSPAFLCQALLRPARRCPAPHPRRRSPRPGRICCRPLPQRNPARASALPPRPPLHRQARSPPRPPQTSPPPPDLHPNSRRRARAQTCHRRPLSARICRRLRELMAHSRLPGRASPARLLLTHRGVRRSSRHSCRRATRPRCHRHPPDSDRMLRDRLFPMRRNGFR